MDKKDRVMMIFLQECREIIETLENKILVLEDNTNDKEMIDDIFRGIHTLKGNANSFGFTRLGNFVHYFEDYLDIFRKNEKALTEDEADLLIRGFDIVKEIFEIEESGNSNNPPQYDAVLNEIKSFLNIEPIEEKSNNTNDLEDLVETHSFSDDNTSINQSELKAFDADIVNKIKNDNLKIYHVVMTFDDDLYVRGYNHQLFFKLFADIGEIAYSYVKLSKDIPSLEVFDTEKSYVQEISTYLLSTCDMDDVEDVFEFIAEENEVQIALVDVSSIDEAKKEPVIEIKEEPVVKNTEVNKVIAKEQNTQAQTQVQKQTKAQAPAASIRVESSKLDELFDSIGELVIAQSFISQSEKIRNINDNEINQYMEMLGKSTKIIQNKVMSLRMIPIRDTFLKMKRVARDVSKKTGKDIDLIISGEETEIDKTMVDKLSEPLIHLLRNSIDHGIEDQDVRIANGKEEKGTVHLSASHKGSNFVIEIKDDGAGIKKDVILAKAIEKGVAFEGEEYTDEEIVNFIFAAGFSTAASLTDISGRGVGLDAVKTSIEELRGKVNVETTEGKGSVFKIVLPLTLAIIDGLTVKVDDDTFIIPTLSVIESFRPLKDDIQRIRNKGEFINYRGEILPIVRVNKLLEVSEDNKCFEDSTLICIEHDRGKYVLQVDELLGRQQVVIKSLGKMMKNLKEISGAAILGSGNIALILNTEGIRDWLDSGDKHHEQ